MKKKLLIFDFDGTLADTFMHIYNCFKRCIVKYNLNDITVENFYKINGSDLGDILKLLGANDDRLNEIKEFYSNSFLEDISDIKLYNNVKETLEELKNRGYLLAIATNRGSTTLSIMLKEFGIFDLFDMFVCINHVKIGKPHPEMINIILDKLNVSGDDAIMFGDTNYDILLGQNANVNTCYTCHTELEDRKVMDCKPDYIIHDFKEIFDTLEN